LTCSTLNCTLHSTQHSTGSDCTELQMLTCPTLHGVTPYYAAQNSSPKA
jgi:hypothetical protein